jgi:hypothetical protein
MIKTRTETINGKIISVTQLPARRAIRLKARLLKLLAPTFGALFDSAPRGRNILSTDIPPAAFGKALEKLAETLQPEEYESLILESLSGTKIDNSDISTQTFDIIFGGELLFLYKVVWFSVKVQFEDFFGEGGIGKLLQRIPQEVVPPLLKQQKT